MLRSLVGSEMCIRDRRTDVIIKAFDKYGIERVEVSENGGEFVALSNPTLHSVTPTVDDIADGVRLTFRAVDPNSNVSPLREITIFPYDAEAGAPRAEVVNP